MKMYLGHSNCIWGTQIVFEAIKMYLRQWDIKKHIFMDCSNTKQNYNLQSFAGLITVWFN